MAKEKYPFDEPLSLMNETIRLCREHGDLLQLWSETRVSYFWLRKFINGEFKNPSVNRIQWLYEHLTKKKLIEEKKDA